MCRFILAEECVISGKYPETKAKGIFAQIASAVSYMVSIFQLFYAKFFNVFLSYFVLLCCPRPRIYWKKHMLDIMNKNIFFFLINALKKVENSQVLHTFI
jgi:hypothetical protein